MGVQVSWNGFTWGHTPRTARSVADFSTGNSVSIEQTENKSGKTVQTSTFDLKEVSLSYVANVSAGVDPMADLRKLSGMVGTYAPLFQSGSRVLGVAQYLLESVAMSGVLMDGRGRIVSATIALKWKEYRTSGSLMAKTGAKAKLRPGVRTYSERKSALSIGQGAGSSKQPVNGQMARW